MKILYLVTKSNYGGAQRYVYDLATRLSASESVSVGYGGTGTPGSEPGMLDRKLKAFAIPTFYLKNLGRDYNPINELLAFFEIYSLVKKESPDVLHANSSKAMLLGALVGRIRGVQRVVITIHGLPYKETHRGLLWRSLAYIGTFVAILLAHKTIAVSITDLENIRKIPIVGKKAVCIYNGISLPNFYSREKAKAELLSKIGAEFAGKKLIGTIAELTKNKGLGYAIAAMPVIVKKIPDARLVIIGSGELETDLRVLTKLNNVESAVSFVGYIQDAALLLPAFDLFILPSLKEGFPYTILEAGAAGLPIVASEVGGIPEIIVPGKTGLLCPSKDPSAIATQAVEVLTSTRGLEMGKRLKEEVLDNFTIEQMVQKTLASYL